MDAKKFNNILLEVTQTSKIKDLENLFKIL